MTIQTVDESMFIVAFDEMNRSENFSIAARRELFEYFNNLSDNIEGAFELDVIAICCDFAEYDLQLALDELVHIIDQDELAECEDDSERLDYLVDVLQDHTTVIRVKHYSGADTLLVQCF